MADVSFDDLVPKAPAVPPVQQASAPSFDDLIPKVSQSDGSQWHSTITDIPHEIYGAAKTAAGTIADTLNPFSESRHAAYARQANAPSFGEGMIEGAKQVGETGKGLLAIPEAIASPITGTARSVIGHPYSVISGKPYEEAKSDVDTAMLGLSPGRGGLRTIRSPIQPPPAPVANGPLGVTLSEGQETGNLPLIQREQAALRSPDILGKSAHERAVEFSEQQKNQTAGAREGVAKQLDPLNQMVLESPHDAAELITSELKSQKQIEETLNKQRSSVIQSAHENFRNNLSPTKNVLASNPMEAANIVSSSVAQAAEDAQSATNAAYSVLRDLPGEFHPAAFNKVGDKIAAELNKGTNPIRVNPETTPQAAGALRDLDEILGDVKQTRDPDTGRILQREPITPALVEDTRKRLNSFYGDALQSARASNNWSDVRAMRGVMDAFDKQVANRLKKGTFIGGDAADVIDSMEYARAKHSEYRKTFTPQGPGDAVGPAIQQIIGRFEGQAAPPEQITNMLYGKGALPVKIAGRLLQVFGENSPEIGAIKQGLFSYITERPPGAEAWGPAQVADRIDALTKGSGSTLTRAYLNPTEIRNLQTYGKVLRRHDDLINSPQDAVDKTIARITGTDGAPPASTQDTVNRLFKTTMSGERNSVELANRLKSRFGESSPQYVAFKQGLFRYAIEPGEGLADWGPKKIGDNLNKLLNVTGKQGADVIYSQQDRALIQKYADLMRKLEIPQTGANWSNTASFTAKYLNKMGGLIGAALGSVIGHAVGLPFGVAELTGLGASKVAGTASGALNARQISKQMPLVSDAMRKWQQASIAVQKTNSPLSNKALSVATANLGRSLQPFGLNLESIMGGQGTVPAIANQNQQNIPGPPSQQPNSDSIDQQQHFASGGRVEKLSHSEVGYLNHSKLGAQRCAYCTMFIPLTKGGPGCTLVKNPIKATGWCNRFKRKT